MKIAFILGEFPLLSESFIVNQITGMIDLGHDVKIFSIKKNEENLQHPKIKKYNLLEKTTYLDIPRNRFMRVIKVPYLILKNMPNARILKSLNVARYGVASLALYNLYFADIFLNRDEEFDIIHCHFGGRGMYGLFLKDLGIKGKLIVTFHGGDTIFPEKMFGKSLYPFLFRKADLFMTNTQFTKDKLIQLGCNEKKIMVLGMGTNTNIFKPKKVKRSSSKNVSLITIGRLAPEKGHKYAIQAILKLSKKYPYLKYRIVGKGPLKESLEELVNQNNLRNFIEFTGPVSQKKLMSLLNESDIFLLPSVSDVASIEGQGVVLQEAQSLKLPVIATNIGGIKYGLIDGKTGFLVSQKNPAALAQKIEFLIKDPKTRAKMGENGRLFVKENYDLDKLNKKLSDTYKRLLNG